MIPARLVKPHFPGVCLLLSLICLCGCGTAQYESLLLKKIDAARGGAAWARFWDYSTLPGTPVKVRIPEILTHSYRLNSPHVSDGDRISHDRAQPPFLELPGFRLVFEDFYNEGPSKTPYYCYLAAQPAKPEQVKALADDLLAKLKAKYPTASPVPAWEDVDCKTPEGATIAWKKLSLVCNQNFDFDPGGGNPVQPRELSAAFELWLYEAQGYYVLIGWRISTLHDSKIGLMKMTAATAGSVQISDPAAAAPAP